MKRKEPDSEKQNQSSTGREREAEQESTSPAAGVGPVSSLHRIEGNQAVQRLYEAGEIQAKLAVSQPGDEAEREAERVAEKIVETHKDGTEAQAIESERPQREMNAGVTPPKQINRSVNGGKISEESESRVRGGAQGSGEPLPLGTRSYFESKMSTDFSDVRVHTGAGADEAARAINAKAYTVGSDIVFSEGNYTPESKSGKKLLAHELTHVIQQRADDHSVQRQAEGEKTEKQSKGEKAKEMITSEVDIQKSSNGEWFSKEKIEKQLKEGTVREMRKFWNDTVGKKLRLELMDWCDGIEEVTRNFQRDITTKTAASISAPFIKNAIGEIPVIGPALSATIEATEKYQSAGGTATASDFAALLEEFINDLRGRARGSSEKNEFPLWRHFDNISNSFESVKELAGSGEGSTEYLAGYLAGISRDLETRFEELPQPKHFGLAYSHIWTKMNESWAFREGIVGRISIKEPTKGSFQIGHAGPKLAQGVQDKKAVQRIIKQFESNRSLSELPFKFEVTVRMQNWKGWLNMPYYDDVAFDGKFVNPRHSKPTLRTPNWKEKRAPHAMEGGTTIGGAGREKMEKDWNKVRNNIDFWTASFIVSSLNI